jgi:hypothetical protein
MTFVCRDKPTAEKWKVGQTPRKTSSLRCRMDRLALTTNTRKNTNCLLACLFLWRPSSTTSTTDSVCVCVCVWCWHFFVYESVTPVKSVQLWQLYRFFLPFSGSQLTRLNVVIRIIANKEREKEEMYGNSLLLLIRCRGSVRGPLFCLYITKARQSLNRNDANVASHPITSKSLARLYM